MSSYRRWLLREPHDLPAFVTCRNGFALRTASRQGRLASRLHLSRVMPSPSEILAGLTAIANEAAGAAIAWHILLAVALVALVRGWRPSQRAAGMLIAAPLASVAGLAFAFGNPFNGIVFSAGAIALLVLARRAERRPVAPGPAWAWWAGVAMIGYGWVYPHFLDAPPTSFLYAAPMGLIPCPTLSVAIGLALLAGGAAMRGWRLTLAALGMFYGLFGVFRLGVLLDVGLVGGALALVAIAVPFSTSTRGRSDAPTHLRA